MNGAWWVTKFILSFELKKGGVPKIVNDRFWIEMERRQESSMIHSTRAGSDFDPLGQPKVTAGRGHCFWTCCPYVHPHFSNLEKQNNRKQCSLQAWLWVWPSGSLMVPVLFPLYFWKKWEQWLWIGLVDQY